MKLGIGAGIGLFLAIIGLEIMGVVGDHPVTLVTLGNLKDPIVLLACLAFVTMIVLEKLKIKGNIIKTPTIGQKPNRKCASIFPRSGKNPNIEAVKRADTD